MKVEIVVDPAAAAAARPFASRLGAAPLVPAAK